jgi:hypothetical protein
VAEPVKSDRKRVGGALAPRFVVGRFALAGAGFKMSGSKRLKP